MPSDRLTKTLVDRLEPAAKDYFEWCGKLSGFGVRVWPTGRKSFVVQYRTGGRGSKTQRKTIGTYGKITAEEARKKAMCDWLFYVIYVSGLDCPLLLSPQFNP